MAELLVLRQRQRKFHRRSRNGCSICKKKHIRCDERRPLCTYCLRHGGECTYLDTGSTPADGGRDTSSEEPQDEASSPLLIDATPRDPLLGTSIELPYKSRSLFQLFISTKILHSTPVERDENSFVVHRALSHPGFLHAALLMTALQWGWLSGDGEQFRVPYLYHKLQAIRFVNEQLADPEMVVDEGTIAAVASLALVENSLGSAEAMASHLCGLLRIQEMQGKKGRRGTTSLLQRLIQMTARCVKSRRVSNIFDLNRTDQVHQSMIVSLLRIALRPTYDIFILDRDDAPAQTLFEILSKSSQNQSQDNQAVAPLRSVDYSRSDFISSYFYLYAILRENEVDSFILNFFLEQLLVDVCRTEPQMHSGQYSQSLWFWTVMFGACASNIAKVTSPLEAEQIQAIRDVYMVKIHLASQVLGISNWEGAKSKLRLFAWEDGFDGEEELRGLWEDAMWLDRYRPGASFALESAVLTTAA